MMAKRQELEQQLAYANTQVSTLTRQVTECRAEAGNYKAQADAANAKIDNYKAQATAANAQIETYRAQIEAANAQIEHFRSREVMIVQALTDASSAAAQRIAQADTQAAETIAQADAQAAEMTAQADAQAAETIAQADAYKAQIEEELALREAETEQRIAAKMEEAQKENDAQLASAQAQLNGYQLRVAEFGAAIGTILDFARSKSDDFAQSIEALQQQAAGLSSEGETLCADIADAAGTQPEAYATPKELMHEIYRMQGRDALPEEIPAEEEAVAEVQEQAWGGMEIALEEELPTEEAETFEEEAEEVAGEIEEIENVIEEALEEIAGEIVAIEEIDEEPPAEVFDFFRPAATPETSLPVPAEDEADSYLRPNYLSPSVSLEPEPSEEPEERMWTVDEILAGRPAQAYSSSAAPEQVVPTVDLDSLLDEIIND